MRARLFIAPVAGVFATIALACSSTPTPDATVTQFCTDWANAYCQVSLCAFDVAVCTTYQNAVCTSFAAAATQAGGRQYSQPNGKACIDLLNTAYSPGASSVGAATLATLNDACNRAFTGNVPAAGTCANTYDCATGLVCSSSPVTTTPVCAAVTPRAVGAFCADPGDQCQGDSYCTPNGGAPKCVATAGLGEACDAIPCGSANRCLGGVCVARAAQGQTCAKNDDCGPGAPYCDTFPPAVCTNGLSFARGATDCKGISGADAVGPVTGADASVAADSAMPASDAATAADAATSD